MNHLSIAQFLAKSIDAAIAHFETDHGPQPAMRHAAHALQASAATAMGVSPTDILPDAGRNKS